MAIAFFQPKALFSIKTQWGDSSAVSAVQCENWDSRIVAVFSHHRDVRVALDELGSSGFSLDNLTLTGRQTRCWMDYSELTFNSSFDDYRFGSNPKVQKFFSRLFRKGKYLLIVNGSEHDVDTASRIISRRRNHAEVWRFK